MKKEKIKQNYLIKIIKKGFSDTDNHCRTIKTNFDLYLNEKLEQKIKKIKGIEFCFFQSKYTFYISWNELFNDKNILDQVIEAIKNYNIID